MSDRTDSELLTDVSEACDRISCYIAGLSYDTFIADIKTQDAVIRNLEVIGEASVKISPGLKKKHPEIEWASITGMRNKLIHDYFGVNIDIVWNVATTDMQNLKQKLSGLM